MPVLRSSTLTAGLAAAFAFAAASVAMLSAQQPTPIYKDASRPVSERVADLLGRMTLEEKVAQLTTRWTTLKPLQDAEGNFVPAGAPALLGQGLGQLARPSEIGSNSCSAKSRPRRMRQVAILRQLQYPSDRRIVVSATLEISGASAGGAHAATPSRRHSLG